MSLAFLADELLPFIPNEALTREEIKAKFADRESFRTAQVFCLWVADAVSEVALVGSSGTANDDGENRTLALISVTPGTSPHISPLRITAHIPGIIETYGLDET